MCLIDSWICGRASQRPLGAAAAAQAQAGRIQI